MTDELPEMRCKDLVRTNSDLGGRRTGLGLHRAGGAFVVRMGRGTSTPLDGAHDRKLRAGDLDLLTR